MDLDAKLKMLLAGVNERINDQMKKRRFDKKMAVRLRLASVTFAAAVTVLLGLEVSKNIGPWLTNVALILGALITVLSAFGAFFDHRSLWIRRTVSLSRLFDLRRDIQFYVAGVEPEEFSMDQIEKFKDRFSRILQDDLREWLRLRSAGEVGGQIPESSLLDTPAQNKGGMPASK